MILKRTYTAKNGWWQPLAAKLRRNARLLSAFTSGQLALQFLQVLTGFLVIRWMVKEDFAQFTLAFGVQSIFGILVEMGLSSAFLAFIGDKHQDPLQISRYYNAVLYWRKRLFAIVIPVSFLVFLYLTFDKGWSNLNLLLLYIGIPVAIYFQGFASFYGVVLRIKNDISSAYLVNVSLSVFKLLLVYVLYLTGWLSGWMYLLLNTVIIILTAVALSRKTARYRDKTVEADEKARRQVIEYIKPSMLGISFSAIQSQMAVLLISIFGSTAAIADIGALGRLGQLFAFLNAFNSMIIQPWFARMNLKDILKNTFRVVVIMSIPLGLLTVAGFQFPQVFQWLLGDNYTNLGEEFGLALLIGAVGYISAIIHSIAQVQKWIYWWPNVAYVVLFFLVNIVAILFFDLSTTIGVMSTSLLFSLSFLFLMITYFGYGYKYGPVKKLT